MPTFEEVSERTFTWDEAFTEYDIRRNEERPQVPTLVIKHRAGRLLSWRITNMPELHGAVPDAQAMEGEVGSRRDRSFLATTNAYADIMIEAQAIVAQVLIGTR